MITKITNYLVNKGLQNSVISEDDISVYLYGYTLILEMAVNIIISIIIGLVFQSLLSVIVFLLVFMPLRSYSGGYHANSALACTIISNVTIAVAVIVVKYELLNGVVEYVPIIEALIVMLISLMSPVDTANKRLSKSEKKRCQSIVVFILLIAYIFQIVFFYNGLFKLVLIIFVATVADLLSLLLQKSE